MPYSYLATKDGKLIKGTIGVISENAAEEALQNAGYNILALELIKPKRNLEELFPTLWGVKRKDIIEFSRQLATLIESGISLSVSLHMLKEQTAKPSLKKVISGLDEELQGGNSLGSALSKYPDAFPDIYCRIVGAGEKSGNLEGALKQAIKYLERGVSATQKVKRAMVYPSIIVLLAIGVVVLLLTVALPPLLKMFDQMNVELPWTTRLLLAISDFLRADILYLAVALLILIIAAVWYVRRPEGRLLLDKMLLRIPLIGPINIKSNMALFSRTTAVLLSAGVPLSQVIAIARQTTANKVINQAVGEVQEGLMQGRGLSQPMAINRAFPPLLVQVVMVGEQTGTLDSNLNSIADFFDNEVDQRVDFMMTLIEPIMIIMVGLVVGFIALSVIMPMYTMYKHIQ